MLVNGCDVRVKGVRCNDIDRSNLQQNISNKNRNLFATNYGFNNEYDEEQFYSHRSLHSQNIHNNFNQQYESNTHQIYKHQHNINN